MARVKFTPNLKTFFPTLTETYIEAETVAQLIVKIEARWPGLADYLVDERGALRKHVNIFIGGDLIVDRQTLSDPLEATSWVYIMQALSGG